MRDELISMQFGVSACVDYFAYIGRSNQIGHDNLPRRVPRVCTDKVTGKQFLFLNITCFKKKRKKNIVLNAAVCYCTASCREESLGVRSGLGTYRKHPGLQRICIILISLPSKFSFASEVSLLGAGRLGEKEGAVFPDA